MINDKKEYFNESKNESLKSKKFNNESKKRLLETIKFFEQNIIDNKNRVIKYLTKLNIVLFVCVVLLSISIIVLTPLKTSIPYVLRVDNTTGYVDKVEPYAHNKTGVNEAVLRYFLSRYIEKREGYDWNLIQTMFDYIQATSNDSTFASYKNYILSDSSPLKVLNKKYNMLVKLQGITFLNDDTAQIRFTKGIAEMDGKPASNFAVTHWLATVKFSLTAQITTEKERLINPLGLIVIDYKVDPEVTKQ